MKDPHITKQALESTLPVIIKDSFTQTSGAQISLDEVRAGNLGHLGTILICENYPWDDPYQKGIAESLKLAVDAIFAVYHTEPVARILILTP